MPARYERCSKCGRGYRADKIVGLCCQECIDRPHNDMLDDQAFKDAVAAADNEP